MEVQVTVVHKTEVQVVDAQVTDVNKMEVQVAGAQVADVHKTTVQMTGGQHDYKQEHEGTEVHPHHVRLHA